MARSHPIRTYTLAVALLLAGVTASCRAAAPPPRHHVVRLRGVAFTPAALEVVPGDSVTWINDDIVPHTVSAADGRWDSGDLPPGAVFGATVEKGGAVAYLCRYHPTMTGVLRSP